MRGRGFAVGVRGHGSGEGERPGEMGGSKRCLSCPFSLPGTGHKKEKKTGQIEFIDFGTFSGWGCSKDLLDCLGSQD